MSRCPDRPVDTLTILLDTIKLCWRRPLSQGKAQIGNSGSREAIMESNRFGRRRFLKHAGAGLAAGAAGLAAGAEWSARGQSAGPEAKDHPNFGHGEPSRFVTSGRGVRRTINHITYFTPIQDYAGIITPAGLHFVQEHAPYL